MWEKGKLPNEKVNKKEGRTAGRLGLTWSGRQQED